MIDLMGFVNTIITHIANGNKNEERLVNVMGGTIIETESEKWVRQGMQQGIRQAILRKLREKIGLSLEEAKDCLAKYGRHLV